MNSSHPNLLLMVHAPDRKGTINDYPERVGGYDNANCRTDETGRFRIITSPGWPKRLHWYPDEFVSDSVALGKRPISEDYFRNQGTITLKHGPRLTGPEVVDDEGRPLAILIWKS